MGGMSVRILNLLLNSKSTNNKSRAVNSPARFVCIRCYLPQLAGRVSRSGATLRSQTRAPIGEHREEIGCADGAVFIEVGGAAFARAPTCQQRKYI